MGTVDKWFRIIPNSALKRSVAQDDDGRMGRMMVIESTTVSCLSAARQRADGVNVK